MTDGEEKKRKKQQKKKDRKENCYWKDLTAHPASGQNSETIPPSAYSGKVSPGDCRDTQVLFKMEGEDLFECPFYSACLVIMHYLLHYSPHYSSLSFESTGNKSLKRIQELKIVKLCKSQRISFILRDHHGTCLPTPSSSAYTNKHVSVECDARFEFVKSLLSQNMSGNCLYFICGHLTLFISVLL